MREVTGSTWSFQIIIFFILIFACFLTLVLSYSKAYSVKNRTLSILEKYEGVTPESAEIINNYMNSNGYKQKGKCPTDGDWHGATKISNGYEYKKAEANEEYFYCIEGVSEKGKKYYNIIVFYKFNLPVLGDITTFKIKGRTNNFVGARETII